MSCTLTWLHAGEGRCTVVLWRAPWQVWRHHAGGQGPVGGYVVLVPEMPGVVSKFAHAAQPVPVKGGGEFRGAGQHVGCKGVEPVAGRLQEGWRVLITSSCGRACCCCAGRLQGKRCAGCGSCPQVSSPSHAGPSPERTWCHPQCTPAVARYMHPGAPEGSPYPSSLCRLRQAGGHKRWGAPSGKDLPEAAYACSSSPEIGYQRHAIITYIVFHGAG